MLHVPLFKALQYCSIRRLLKRLPALLVALEPRCCMHLVSRVASLVQAASKFTMILQRVGPNLLFVGSYLHLARIFAKGGSRARKFRWNLKFLRMKRGGLFDSASWTVRFSKVIKM
jgi:hypothetical protein